jgi:hypothetical protein
MMTSVTRRSHFGYRLFAFCLLLFPLSLLGSPFLSPLDEAVLNKFRVLIVSNWHTVQGIGSVHWLAYAYAGPYAKLDTSWQPNHLYLTGEMTYSDDGNRVFRAAQGGSSGSQMPNWNTVNLGDELQDGNVKWVYFGPPRVFSAFDGNTKIYPTAEELGEHDLYYDALGAAILSYLYLSKLHDPEAEEFRLFIKYVRGAIRDTYDDRVTIPGNRIFSRGYRLDATNFASDPDATTVDWIKGLRKRDNASYRFSSSFNYSNTADTNGAVRGRWESQSREVAYVGRFLIALESLGEARQPDSGYVDPITRERISNSSGTLIEFLVAWAENHLWEWKSAEYENPQGGRLAPFMFGLTAGFLGEFYEWETSNGRNPEDYWPKKHWPNIPSALGDLNEFIYTTAVVRTGPEKGKPLLTPNAGNGYAVARQDDGPNADDNASSLLMLFCHSYAFVGKWHADQGRLDQAAKYFDWADHLFVSALFNFQPTNKGKDWFQQLFHSFDYLRWREAVEIKGGTRPSPPTHLRIVTE